MNTRIVLLPGLDGTGRLFKRLLAAAPSTVSVTPVGLPAQALSYDAVAEMVAPVVPDDGGTVILAESYSGPAAVAVARRRRVRALVFCNSFVSAPRSRLFVRLVAPTLFRRRFVGLAARRYLVGPEAGPEVAREVVEAVASVPPPVLAARLRAVLQVSMMSAFAQCTAPTLYLRGTHDRIVSEASWRRMAAARQIALVRVAGPHLLLQVKPVESWTAILSFLESLPAV